jgi:fibronectin type 3 domain-containing protein
VYRSTSLNGAYAMANASAVGTNSFTDTGLDAGATYYYKVTAVDAAGETDPSNAASGTIRPIAPTGVSAATISASSISITWTAVSGAVSYNVYRSVSLDGTYEKANNSVIVSNSFLDTGLNAATTYYYKVTAVNAGGESVQSNTVFTITSPNAPTELSAEAKNTKIINITWANVSGAASYNVFRSLTVDGIYEKVNTSTIGENKYTDTNLSKGTTYYYKVTAVNAGGESVQSNSVNATTKGHSNYLDGNNVSII